MKKLLLLVALLTSFLLVSCSESVTDPVQGDKNKSSNMMDNWPYEELQGFEEVKVLDWNLPGTSTTKDLSIRIDRNTEDLQDIFIMVTFGDPLVDTEGEHVLYYINQPGEDRMKLRIDREEPIKSIKAFVLASVFETEPAYENNYMFRGVYSTWEVRDNQLVITAMPFTPDIIELFAHIDKPGTDQLVYLRLPSNHAKIIIPDYEMKDVQGVHLFVNSLVDKD